MHTWLIRPGDPAALTLAADARLAPVDYCNDQIWELSVGRGEPPAISMQTTYGLRTRSLRIFPRFGEGDQLFSDPDAFASPIRLQHIYPSALQLLFAPLPEISAQSTYWVPQSHTAAGQITLTNTSAFTRQVRLEWVVLLAPGASGERMSLQEIEAVQVLAGTSQDLAPVFFINGGMRPGSGSYPSLALSVDLATGESHTFTWALATLSNHQDSFNLARQVTDRNWPAEMARLEMLDAGLLDIRTGEESWDHALAVSQNIARSLFSGPTPALPHPSFVITRQPDQGFSLRGDGSDYNHLWNGQSALEALYLSGLLLPSSPQLIRGVLSNFISVQAESGTIDWKPGLGGQRSQLNATPLLASLAWVVYQHTADLDFLKQVLDPLYDFFRSWFAPQRDRDNDGIPEWTHATQTGVEDHPFFAHWHDATPGVDPASVESPDLCAYLYRECTTLQQIARLLLRTDITDALQPAADNLKAAVEASWSRADSCYHYWDRDTHASPGPEAQFNIHWPDLPELPVNFNQPVRLLLRVFSADGTARRVQVYLHGSGAGGGHQVEPIPPESFRWRQGSALAGSQRSYTSLDHLEVQGLEPDDSLEIQNIDFTTLDISLLIPLWAGIASPEHAASLVQNTITNPKLFWLPYGLCTVAAPSGKEDDTTQAVNLPLNVFLAEGLLTYGFRAEAVELVTRLMHLTAQTLARDGAFRFTYNAESGSGLGERNALNGLAPLGLFLKVLGLQITQPYQVFLHGFNPFPWPVTVKYRGTTILCQKDKTTVIFPDGQTTTLSEPGNYLVSMDRSGAVKQSRPTG